MSCVPTTQNNVDFIVFRHQQLRFLNKTKVFFFFFFGSGCQGQNISQLHILGARDRGWLISLYLFWKPHLEYKKCFSRPLIILNSNY